MTVWIVARKSNGEAMAVYDNEADANEHVRLAHRSHRDRYKVEAWMVGGIVDPTNAPRQKVLVLDPEEEPR